jgi:hypothetical protein
MSNASTVRSALVALALGAATATVLAAVVLPSWAQSAHPAGAVDRQLHLRSANFDGEGRHNCHLDQQG